VSISALHVKPEEIDTPEKRAKYTVSIIGSETSSIVCAYLFAEAGFKVVYANPDQATANMIAKGKAHHLKQETESKLKSHVRNGRLIATSDIKSAVSQGNIIAVMMPPKIDEKKKVDYSQMENTCKKVGASLCRDSLVIVLSVVGFGITESTIKQILEDTSGFRVGTDLGLAYSPIRVFDRQTLESVANRELIVAAPEKNSLAAASAILGTIARKGIKKTLNVKTAEAGILFEAVQYDANIALTNEFGILCEKAGLDYLETQKLLSDVANSSVLFPMFTEKNVREETYLLLDSAESLNAKLRIPMIAREINDDAVRHVVNLTQGALRECGKTLKRARIALLGITQTRNERSTPKAMVKELARMLAAKGAKVNLHDPYLSENELAETQFPFKKSLVEALEGVDCAIISTGHDQFKRLNLNKLKFIMKKPAVIIDLEGVVEPDKIEKEGLIYRGLGRGVWKK
jgi:nucleotide sugar dehydrogenase